MPQQIQRLWTGTEGVWMAFPSFSRPLLATIGPSGLLISHLPPPPSKDECVPSTFGRGLLICSMFLHYIWHPYKGFGQVYWYWIGMDGISLLFSRPLQATIGMRFFSGGRAKGDHLPKLLPNVVVWIPTYIYRFLVISDRLFGYKTPLL